MEFTSEVSAAKGVDNYRCWEFRKDRANWGRSEEFCFRVLRRNLANQLLDAATEHVGTN